MLKKLMLLLASLVFSLLVCELIVRLFVPVRNVGPTFSVYDPYYGKRLKRNFHSTRTALEFTMSFTTNSAGFRGPEPASLPVRPILFLGDSFTAGYGVNDGEEFPQLVKKALDERYGVDRIPVVNAASGNIGNGYWIKFLKTEGRRYNPRVVVIQLCSNDFDDNMEDRLFELTPSGDLSELSSPPVRSNLRRMQELIDYIPGLSDSYFISLARQVFSESVVDQNRSEPEEEGDEELTDLPKERLTYLLMEKILTTFEREKLPVLALSADVQGRRLERIAEIFRRHQVPFVIAPAKDQRPDLYYTVDGHWRASGHAVVARLITERLFADFNLD